MAHGSLPLFSNFSEKTAWRKSSASQPPLPPPTFFCAHNFCIFCSCAPGSRKPPARKMMPRHPQPFCGAWVPTPFWPKFARIRNKNRIWKVPPPPLLACNFFCAHKFRVFVPVPQATGPRPTTLSAVWGTCDGFRSPLRPSARRRRHRAKNTRG
jgi:hypothetical protein